MQHHWKHLLPVLIGTICLLLAGPADAQHKDTSETVPALYDAQEIMDACDNHATESLASDVSDVVRGHIETAACLKASIVSHMEAMFEPEVLTPAYVEWMLLGMAHPTAELYWFLWTGHRGCDCGEEAEAADVEAVVTLYKSLLRDVIYQRNAYGL